MKPVYRRRNLPHHDVPGKPVFLTACLHGSIPAAGFGEIGKYSNQLKLRQPSVGMSGDEWELRKHKLLFAFIDGILDGECPVRHLEDPALARIVMEAFLNFAGERYHLYAFVVMPSHHHWVFLPDEVWGSENVPEGKTAREVVSKSIQGFTARMCNRALGTSGQFWQRETYDHWIRDPGELLRVIEYVEQNPVKAGLVGRAEEYPWSSARIREELGLGSGERIPKVDVA